MVRTNAPVKQTDAAATRQRGYQKNPLLDINCCVLSVGLDAFWLAILISGQFSACLQSSALQYSSPLSNQGAASRYPMSIFMLQPC